MPAELFGGSEGGKKRIADGYETIVCSCFNEANYKAMFAAKLPLQYFQPIQAMHPFVIPLPQYLTAHFTSLPYFYVCR